MPLYSSLVLYIVILVLQNNSYTRLLENIYRIDIKSKYYVFMTLKLYLLSFNYLCLNEKCKYLKFTLRNKLFLVTHL